MFKVPVRTQMAPKMEFLAYCVLPSETVLAASRTFQTEKCLENKVCWLSPLQYGDCMYVKPNEYILYNDQLILCHSTYQIATHEINICT